MNTSARIRILHLAGDCLVDETPPKLPISCKGLLRHLVATKNDLQLWTFQKYLQEEQHLDQTNEWDILKFFHVIDGKTIYFPSDDIHIIFYNRDMPAERKKWTIAHELGHIFCQHFRHMPVTPGTPRNDDYNLRVDTEADYFARSLLAPPWLIFLISSHYDRMDVIAYYTILRSVLCLSKEASFRISISMHNELSLYRPSALFQHWHAIANKFFRT